MLACGGDAAPPRSFTVPVVTAPVVRGPAEVRVTLDGEVRSPGEALISAEIAGTVTDVPARIGSDVRRGEVLLELDGRPARIALAQAKAGVSQADATVAVKRAAFDRVRVASSRILEVAAKDPGAISSREVEDARLGLSEAESAWRAGEAELAVRAAAAEAAELDVARTVLRSPVAGIVSRQEARIGQRVTPGTLLAGVVAGGALEVVLDVGEVWAGRIVPGAAVAVSVPSRPDIVAAGVIGGVVPAAETGSRNQRARVDLPDPPPGLIPGLAVRAVVEVEKIADALQVPRDAVSGGAVYVVAESKAVRVPVTVRSDAGAVLVVEGSVEAGANVVVRGNEALQDGTPVSVVQGAGT